MTRILFGLLLLLASGSFAGCGRSIETSASSARIQQADTVAPSYYTRFDGTPAYPYIASEVDESGRTFILAQQGPAQEDQHYRVVFESDTGGRQFSRVGTASNQLLFNRQRVRGGVVALVGTTLHPGTPVSGERLVVRALDTNGRSLFTYDGGVGTAGVDVDVCADGSVIAGGARAGAALLVRLDPTGVASWTANAAIGGTARVRCLTNGKILVGGGSSAGQYEADGSPDWEFAAPHAGAVLRTFDVDDSGAMVLGGDLTDSAGTHYVVYAVDPGGRLRWSWVSDGATDTFAALATDGDGSAVATGSRGPRGARHFHTARLDRSGAVSWVQDGPVGASRDAQASGVALDGNGNAFVCGRTDGGTAVLYGPDGSPLWSYTQPDFSPSAADVTNGVARCIGSAGDTFAVLAFALP